MFNAFRLSPSIAATIVVGGTIVTWLVCDSAYVQWRNRKVAEVPLGASRAEVIVLMGDPESHGDFFTPGCASSPKQCDVWSVHDNFQYVCFGPDDRVVCRGTYTVWE